MSVELAEWVQAYGLWGLTGAAFVGATLVPISSEVAFVAALKLGLDPVTALVWASVGNTAGCLVNYGLGRWSRDAFGDRLSSSRAGRTAVRWLERWGASALLLSWAPIIGDPLTVAAGVARVRLGLFVTLVASLRVGRYALLLWAV
ncbi:YqaA family protein [Rubrivirga sp.]|uniref:YqaA family protein n=1 Tax=Rubrivirga sp. TaxID=1885344 RepID=UPI003C735FB3